jgi:hypothetical protein
MRRQDVVEHVRTMQELLAAQQAAIEALIAALDDAEVTS